MSEASIDMSALDNTYATGLQEQIPELMVKNTDSYRVHYGVRSDDSALVFQFFPPEGGWEKDINDRMEKALIESFQVGQIDAQYVSELSSYSIIIHKGGDVPDPVFASNRFLAKI